MRQNIIVFFLGVLLGLIPMYVENQRIKQDYKESRASLESETARAQSEFQEINEKFRVALLRDQLSSLILEVEDDNFGSARLQSTNLFNRVRDTLPAAETPAVREALRKLLDRRDDITAALVSNDSRAAAELREIHEGFPRATTLTPSDTQAGSVSQQAQAPAPAALPGPR
jgi:molecular chaperone GrpE (heat shock protein)